MLYAVDKEDLQRWTKAGPFLPTFSGAEMLMVGFHTDPGVVAKVLPKPLDAHDEGVAFAFVAEYPETNFGITYREGALVVPARFRGETGGYCLAMPVDNDMAMVGGREQHGFPKKIAEDITIEHHEGVVSGRVVRRGEEILRIEATAAEDADIQTLHSAGLSVVEDLEGALSVAFVSFLFKFFPDTSGRGFEWAPRLIRQVTLFRPRTGLRAGTAKITLSTTPTDPLAEIPVHDVVAAAYGIFDNVMLPGKVVAKVRNPKRFARHAFFSTDSFAMIDPEDQPSLTRRERRKLWKRVESY